MIKLDEDRVVEGVLREKIHHVHSNSPEYFKLTLTDRTDDGLQDDVQFDAINLKSWPVRIFVSVGTVEMS